MVFENISIKICIYFTINTLQLSPVVYNFTVFVG